MLMNKNKPISGRVVRASTTETVNLYSVSGRVKQKTLKRGSHGSLFDVEQSKRQREASTEW